MDIMINLGKRNTENDLKTKPRIYEPMTKKKFWEDEEWRKKEIEKMERNKKATEKRQEIVSIEKFNEYLKSGRRTY